MGAGDALQVQRRACQRDGARRAAGVAPAAAGGAARERDGTDRRLVDVAVVRLRKLVGGQGPKVQSVSGGGHWGGGMLIDSYDMARFGYLFLRNGKWMDRDDYLRKVDRDGADAGAATTRPTATRTGTWTPTASRCRRRRPPPSASSATARTSSTSTGTTTSSRCSAGSKATRQLNDVIAERCRRCR